MSARIPPNVRYMDHAQPPEQYNITYNIFNKLYKFVKLQSLFTIFLTYRQLSWER